MPNVCNTDPETKISCVMSYNLLSKYITSHRAGRVCRKTVESEVNLIGI